MADKKQKCPLCKFVLNSKLTKRFCTLALIAKCYAVAIIILVFCLLVPFLYDTLAYALGFMWPEEITLTQSEKYALHGLTLTEEQTLLSTSSDAYMIVNANQTVRRVSVVADYNGKNAERDLYYRYKGFGFTPNLRVWPVLSSDAKAYNYNLPLLTAENVRLDLADAAQTEIHLYKIIINEPLAWYSYFVPSVWQLFWFLMLPAVANGGIMVFIDIKKVILQKKAKQPMRKDINE